MLPLLSQGRRSHLRPARVRAVPDALFRSTLDACRAPRSELLTSVRALDHASDKPTPADAEPGEHVLALVTAHPGCRCGPVVRLLLREAPDPCHPTSFRADPTPLRGVARAPSTRRGVARPR